MEFLFKVLHIEIWAITGLVMGLITATAIIMRKYSHGSKLAWIMIVILVPILGIPLYLLLGGRKQKRLAAGKEKLYEIIKSDTSKCASNVERILLNTSPPIRHGNSFEMLDTAEKAYSKLMETLRNAKKSIYIGIYILGSDEVADAIVNVLLDKARQGLDVRLFVDGVYKNKVNRARFEALRASGGKCEFFMDTYYAKFAFRPDLRNHRKIIMIDSETAMVGGMNISKDYMGDKPFKGRFKDLSVFVKGPIVKDILYVYAKDWNFISKENLPLIDIDFPEKGNAMFQVVPSGPDVVSDPIYDSLLTAIYNAKESILIATPYFGPNDELTHSLILASKRGVEVTIIVPRKTDHWVIDLAAKVSLREIENVGGKIFFYEPCLMHAKVAVFDDKYAEVGSANFDMRSLFLNYEIILWVYSEKEIQDLKKWILDLIPDSSLGLDKLTPFKRYKENLVRLAAPLL